MKPVLVASEVITVGQAVTFEAKSPSMPFAVLFEDDGETGFLYAMDLRVEQSPIVDAVLIYDVAEVWDKDKPSTLQIVWSGDGTKAMLLINRNPHAVFDFAGERGYSRLGFPGSTECWPESDHRWDDAVLQWFR